MEADRKATPGDSAGNLFDTTDPRGIQTVGDRRHT